MGRLALVFVLIAQLVALSSDAVAAPRPTAPPPTPRPRTTLTASPAARAAAAKKIATGEIPTAGRASVPRTVVLRSKNESKGPEDIAKALSAPKLQIHQSLGLPTPNPTKFPKAMTLARNGFVSIYDPDRKVPIVVSWTTTPKDLRIRETSDDYNTFHEDTELPPNVPRATLADYRNSGYDRGHMVRQIERPIARDRDANDATYSLVNIIPQARNNNSGAWAHLEDWYRDQIVDEKKTAYLQAGPIFEGPTKTIGNGVAVPSHTYKIIVLADAGVDLKKITTSDIGTRVKVFGVIVPNDDAEVKLDDHWAKFVVPVSEIAERAKCSGFLAGLPDEVRAMALARRPPVTAVGQRRVLAGRYVVDGMSVP